MKNEKKNTEFEHFSTLANDWWSKNGKFKILHDIQPIRIKLIKIMSGKSDGSLISQLLIYQRILMS